MAINPTLIAELLKLKAAQNAGDGVLPIQNAMAPVTPTLPTSLPVNMPTNYGANVPAPKINIGGNQTANPVQVQPSVKRPLYQDYVKPVDLSAGKEYMSELDRLDQSSNEAKTKQNSLVDAKMHRSNPWKSIFGIVTSLIARAVGGNTMATGFLQAFQQADMMRLQERFNLDQAEVERERMRLQQIIESNAGEKAKAKAKYDLKMLEQNSLNQDAFEKFKQDLDLYNDTVRERTSARKEYYDNPGEESRKVWESVDPSTAPTSDQARQAKFNQGILKNIYNQFGPEGRSWLAEQYGGNAQALGAPKPNEQKALAQTETENQTRPFKIKALLAKEGMDEKKAALLSKQLESYDDLHALKIAKGYAEINRIRSMIAQGNERIGISRENLQLDRQKFEKSIKEAKAGFTEQKKDYAKESKTLAEEISKIEKEQATNRDKGLDFGERYDLNERSLRDKRSRKLAIDNALTTGQFGTDAEMFANAAIEARKVLARFTGSASKTKAKKTSGTGKVGGTTFTWILK